ncbi:MAG: glycosyltransferase family 4 protein [Acidimicrobiia bacterium]|nr:glycosyltransferase family 4 protein [Acidimicrobiia bacterium]
MVKRILSGFRKAARVTCDSFATRDELLAYGLIEPERLVVVHNGVHEAFSPEADTESDREAARLIGSLGGVESVEVLHVGSTVGRKRIDVLLNVFATLRERFPGIKLLRVGGEFTVEQAALAARLNLGGSIVSLPTLERKVLAAVYRRAALVLQPSEREGFGLPVVEAMACGTPVVAFANTAIPEVVGDGGELVPDGDVAAMVRTVTAVLADDEMRRSLVERGLARAGRFSWRRSAEAHADVYRIAQSTTVR